jgi:transposase-like protein
MALEMYARGLSTRDIEATLTDEAGKPLLSRSSMSRLSEELYAEYEAFATRDLSGLDVVYLFLDGVYEAVRHYTLNQAILCAWGILSDGTKQMIHLEAVGSESRDAWGGFLEDLLARGMPHPLLVVSDGGKGAIAALNKHLPRSKRQRCLTHKLRNIGARAPRDMQDQLLAEAKAVYYAPTRSAAETLAEDFIRTYASSYPGVVKIFSEDLEACLTQLEFPLAHRVFIRTTNLIERAFVEEKRRTKTIPTHVNERGAIKLVFAVLIRASYAWRRVKMTNLDLAHLRTLRAVMCPDEPESKTLSFRLAA